MSQLETEQRKSVEELFVGNIPAELNNPVAIGLIALDLEGKIFHSMLRGKELIETISYVAPARGISSSEGFDAFTEEFSNEPSFARLQLVEVRLTRSGKAPDNYFSPIFKYEEEGAYGSIFLYPSKEHVEAVIEADSLERYQKEGSKIDDKRLEELREAFPK